MPTQRFTISGLVQGVFFRAQAKEKADALGLTGWVRNTNDGGVEIHAEGPEEKLKELEQWCWKGPAKAQVRNIAVTIPERRNDSSFEIWY